MLNEHAALPNQKQVVGGKTMFLASVWVMGMRWSVRGIGLLSTLILVRLLTPNDFGLVAKAMLVVSMLEVMAESGQRLAIIRHPAPTRAHYDTAWTISIMVNGVLAIAIFFAAPLAGVFFGEPNAIPLVRILAIRTLLNGLENIGTVDFRRNMDFSKDFKFNVAKKICGFVVTMSLAVYFRNYIALIGGMVIGQLLAIILSYVMVSYRPRLSLEKLSEIWSFSVWVLVASTGSYLLSRLDQWVVGSRASDAVMGQYLIGSELGQLPTSELIDPVARALYPAYSKLRFSPEHLVTALLSNLETIATLVVPCGVGIACIAVDLAAVLLGKQWPETPQYIAYVALASAVNGIGLSASIVLSVMGNVRRDAALSWIRVVVVLACLIVGMRIQGPLGVAKAYLAASVLLAPVLFFQVIQTIPLRLRQVLNIVWRPSLAAAAMAYVLVFLPLTQISAAPARLAVAVLTGAFAYGLVLLLLWLLAGRPASIEKVLLIQARKLISRIPAQLARRGN
ncbi:MAG: lipopolysaccharide biosynthesis protein [Pseudomonadota bacterium]